MSALHNYKTGEYIRSATDDETEASRTAGPEGVILVEIDGKDVACYVED